MIRSSLQVGSAATDMHSDCQQEKSSTNSLVGPTRFWVPENFLKLASVKRTSLVVRCLPSAKKRLSRQARGFKVVEVPKKVNEMKQSERQKQNSAARKKMDQIWLEGITF
jgi:hypothetical protein